jgi:hypothetical protein
MIELLIKIKGVFYLEGVLNSNKGVLNSMEEILKLT